MRQITLKLADIVAPKKNIRIHTEKQLQEFERSVRMFGQIRPIVVDENNVILAGNGLYETLLRMNKEDALVYKYEDLTEAQKQKLMIADNRIYSLGVDDLEAMNDILSGLGDFDVPGFDEEMLKQMMADEEEITGILSEYGKLDEEETAMVREQAERKESAMRKYAEESDSMPENITEKTVESPSQSDGSATSGDRRFILCPKCGEKIWL